MWVKEEKNAKWDIIFHYYTHMLNSLSRTWKEPMHKEQRYTTKARADSFSLFGVDYSLCILKQREVSLGKDNSLLEVANRCSDGVSLIYQA